MKTESEKYSHLKFEHRSQPLLPRQIFLRRFTFTAILSISIVSAWVLLGMIGYHVLAGLTWVDSFLNAAMIVGGMGPVDLLKANNAKIFAGFYAIFSGVLFLTAFSIMAAPIFHRFLHRFHLESAEGSRKKDTAKT
jgi:hypothetical protein